MNWSRYIYCCFVLLAGSKLAAQSLQGLPENQVIKKYLIDHPFSLKSAADELMLSLPFFEDFSASSVFPDPNKWIDQDAFINSSFAIDPVSVGVATLDAIDKNGDLYAISNSATSSDKLTSQSFDLSAYSLSDDTVRLSFFYQAGGNGEVPELNDSLLLEYYLPNADKWKAGWFATVDSLTDFQQVILEIPDTFYQTGFRFRFRNYTSISVNDVFGGEGALSNVDCWNIDYIMMNTNPVSAHRSINDVCLMTPPRKLMKLYEIVPWLHLNDAQSIMRNAMNYDIRLLVLEDTLFVSRSYYIKDFQTGKIESSDIYGENFPPDTVIRRPDPFDARIVREDNESKEGVFEVVSYLVTSGEQYKQNDTSKITLDFKDFYAYDDGTPEYGFGISGPSTAGALLAYKFRVFKSDTLCAVDMLFNKTRDNFNADLGFNLCVWNDDGGKPGELIFVSSEEYTPGAGSEMPGFKRYPINAEEDLVVTDTVIYVGWMQSTDEFLNLGYDVNRNNLSRTYVNTMGNWYNPGHSLVPGSLMIRAVFGNKKVITGTQKLPETTSDIVLFPNPVSGILTLQANETTIKCFSLYDMSGRLMMQQEGQHKYFDVSGLSPGIYQVLLTTDKGQRINRKIVVSH